MRLSHGTGRRTHYGDVAGIRCLRCKNFIDSKKDERMDEEKHILTMIVDNEPGVLSRVVGLFSARGYNIESLCVAPTIDPQVSRITLVTKANLPELEQIEKQLRKLINVIKLRDLSGKNAVKREMALVCVKAKPDKRAEILRIVDIFRCKVVDTGLEHYIIEVSGNEDKLNAFINLLKPMGIKKIARTGAVALFREPN
jgi:acetolactate synthase-1/3 small subunit